MRFRACAVLALVSGCAGPSAAGHSHWSYEGATGPAHWGSLSPEFVLCSSGKMQSPIDIGRTEDRDLADIVFRYKPVPVDIVNNGHTIQVKYDSGSSIEIDGTAYALAQFHFHAPSEHAIGGRHARAELHLVHTSATGGLAVVGVMLEEGEENPQFQPVWKHFPAAPGPARRHPDLINAADLLPSDRRTIRYEGSLTTPPGTEGVRWNLMVDPVRLSGAQLAALERIHNGNNRPVQPLNGRAVQRDTVAR